MSASKAVYTKLTTDAAITAVVGDRVYKVDASSDDDYPRLVYEVSEEKPPRHYKGLSGILKSTVDVVCEARTPEGAAQLAGLVRAALEGKGTWGGVEVQGCYYNSAIENSYQSEVGVDDYVHTKELSFIIWVNE